MRSDVRNFCGCRLLARTRAWLICIILFVVFGRLALPPALGDGCFVFRWNKGIDINEPTQKAIIVYDAGREDLLLQVKYEGPMEEFGWLIPLPSLPTVRKGSMQPFYELSQLTQQHSGTDHTGVVMRTERRGGQEEAVKAIEVKTIGAYEVAVLSAQDAGSLGRWLKAHDYSIPAGKAGIVDEYAREGWYFIAAKIDLRKSASVAGVPVPAPKDSALAARARSAIQKQLSSGELHPLLISFETPRCIYPLRISAVGGRSSEVSLYVLSTEALLPKFIFEKNLDRLHQRLADSERWANERGATNQTSSEFLRRLRVGQMMNRLASAGGEWEGAAQDYSRADLEAIMDEVQPPTLPDPTKWHSCSR